ncbi:unnamed protein product [Nesidiocoris tenuis]|uniref:Uncharacterized protein n=1 Tax=Nesidiocoris tenuis TaxID=355587 RepID=A0A6H5GRE0_9HEMI|nr:unnamed protein product [Nesidiocoris tenuis]
MLVNIVFLPDSFCQEITSTRRQVVQQGERLEQIPDREQPGVGNTRPHEHGLDVDHVREKHRVSTPATSTVQQQHCQRLLSDGGAPTDQPHGEHRGRKRTDRGASERT